MASDNEIAIQVALASKEAMNGLAAIVEAIKELTQITKKKLEIAIDTKGAIDGLSETVRAVQSVQKTTANTGTSLTSLLNPLNLIPNAFNAITGGVGLVTGAFNGLISGLSSVGSIFTSAITMPFQAAASVFSMITGAIGTVASSFGELVFFIGNVGQAFNTLLQFAQPVINFFSGLASSLMTAINTTADFEKQISNVASVTGASAADMQLLSDAALKVGADTSLSASQAAEALYALGSAGLSTKDAISALEGTAKLSEATQSNLAASTELVVSAIAQYKMQAADATKISNIFAAGINVSQLNMERLGLSLKYVGPVASSFGMTLEQTVATLGALSNAGIMGETAGTSLRSALAELVNPGRQANDALASLGIGADVMAKTFLDASGKGINPLVASLELLKSQGATTAQIMKLFGDQAGPAMLALLNQGTQAITDMQTKVTGTQAAFDAAKIQLDNYRGALLQLSGSIETVQILIGGVFQKSLTLLTNALITAVNGVTTFIQTTGLLTASQIVLTSATQAFLAVLQLLSPIVAVINSAFTTLGIVLATAMTTITNCIVQNDLFKTSFETINTAMTATSEKLSGVITSITGLSPAVLTVKKDLDALKTSVADYAKNLMNSKSAQDLFKTVASSIDAIIKTLATSLTTITTSVIAFISSFKFDTIASGNQILQMLSTSVQQFTTYLTTSITSLTSWASEFIKSGQAFETVKTIFNTGVNIFEGIINVLLRIPAVVSSILPTISQLATGLSGAFVSLTKGDFSGAIQQTFAAITTAITNFIGGLAGNKVALSSAFTSIFDGLTTAFSNIKTTVILPLVDDFKKSLSDGLIKSMGEVGLKMAESIKTIGTTITAGLSSVFSGMKSIGTLLKESLGKDNGGGSEIFAPIIEGVKQGIEILKVTISEGIPALKDMAIPIIKEMITAIKQAIDFLPVSDEIKKGLTLIMDIFKTGIDSGKVAETFKNLLPPIMKVITEIMSEIKKSISIGIKDAIVGGFDVALSGVVIGIGVWMATLSTTLTTAITGLATTFGTSALGAFVKAVATWIGGLTIAVPTAIAGFSMIVGQYLINQGLTWAGYLTTALMTAALAITAGIAAWPAIALAAIATLGLAIYNYLIGNSLIDDIPMWFKAVFAATASFFGTVGATLAAPFMAIWDFIKETVSTVTEYATELVTAIVDTVTEFFTGAGETIATTFDAIWTFMDNTITTVTEYATQIGDGIINTITEIITAGKETITGLFNSIWDGLTAMVDTVIEIGNNIGTGFMDAITGAIEAGQAVIESVVNGIVSIAQGAYDRVMSIVNAAKNIASAPIDAVVSVAETAGDFVGSIGYATGGIVKATPGGIPATVGEGQYNEAIVPLPDGRSIPVSFANMPDFSNLALAANGGGGNVNISFGDVVLNNEQDEREFFNKIDRVVSDALRRNRGR